MEERFLSASSVEPDRRTWSLDPRRWPRVLRPFALFGVLALACSGVGFLISLWTPYDAAAVIAWAFYGGGALLLFLGTAPYLPDEGAYGTLDAEWTTAHQQRHARATQFAETALLLLLGAALIGLGLLVDLKA